MSTPASNPDSSAPSPTTLLIVDDQPENIAVLAELLQPYYRVRAARSGAQCLRSAATDPRPDLILLDVMMPEMDGYAVLSQLRAQPNTHDIPVIFVTALGAEEDERHGLELGAVDYLTKPIKPAIVLARIRTHLELKQARDRLAHQNVWLEHEVAERTLALEQSRNQLIQAEKMAAIGMLAAGIAHELNNPVGFVNSNLGTLEAYAGDLLAIIDQAGKYLTLCQDVQTQEAFRKLLKDKNFGFLRGELPVLIAESKDGMFRMRQIVSDLKDFSRSGDQYWEWADLHKGLDSTLNVVRNELKYKAEVVRQYGALPLVHCVPSQLNQVFMNLLVNAAQAIESHGRITIVTSATADEITVEIHDTGHGITAEHIKQIFDPFFTTKPVGKGTGLGLSIAYGIVQKHHGRIEVESTPGVGSTFRVILPVNPPLPSGELPAAAS